MDDNYKIAKMLLAKGAGVGLVDADLWAPLHVACSCAGQDLVLLLLEVCTVTDQMSCSKRICRV